jgi:hypothetical protein
VKAEEIRMKGIPAPAHCLASARVEGTDSSVAENLGFCFGALQEIAAQLAELNEKLEVDALFESFKTFGDKVDKMPPAEQRRNL